MVWWTSIFTNGSVDLREHSLYDLILGAFYLRKFAISLLNSTGTTLVSHDFSIGPDWTYCFWIYKLKSPATKLAFDLAGGIQTQRNNVFYFDDVQLRTGGVRGLEPYEDPSAGTVARMLFSDRNSYTDARNSDLMRFYADIELNFTATIRTGLTNAGVRIPVTFTRPSKEAHLL